MVGAAGVGGRGRRNRRFVVLGSRLFSPTPFFPTQDNSPILPRVFSTLDKSRRRRRFMHFEELAPNLKPKTPLEP